MTLKNPRGLSIAVFFLLLLATDLPKGHAQPAKPSLPPLSTEESTAKPPQESAAPDPCEITVAPGKTWLDQTHDLVMENLCESAVWFDGFFSEELLLEDVRPGTFVNLGTGVRFTEGESPRYVGDLNASWRLPKFERLLKRARIFFASGSATEPFRNQPGRPYRPGFDPETGTRDPTLGVRLDSMAWLRSRVSADTGLKVGLPLDPFLRIRFQVSRPLGEDYIVRFTETGLWKYTERFTEITQIDLDREFTPLTLLRLSQYVAYTENRPGITWNTGLSLIRELSSNSAVSYDLSMWGVNDPEWTLQNYRAGMRYRRNFHRPWLFLEIEPAVTWPYVSGAFGDPVYALLVSLDVQFSK